MAFDEGIRIADRWYAAEPDDERVNSRLHEFIGQGWLDILRNADLAAEFLDGIEYRAAENGCYETAALVCDLKDETSSKSAGRADIYRAMASAVQVADT